MVKPVRVKRSQFASFLNVTPTGDIQKWGRMGVGITSASVSYNPTVNEEQYIHQDSGNKEVDSYAPTMAGEQTAFKGDEVFDYIDSLRQTRAVGNDAKTELLMVYIYDKEAEGKYKAEKQEVTISVNEFGGEAGGAVTLSYDIGFCGEAEAGTATIVDGVVTFTKNSTPAPANVLNEGKATK
ncbi:phage tail tube protein [Candidatus Stoquefichus sp. SB1]|uniref:phage tail tube protein n=1 Tax=Candidatus Stoquefichus sp. SB1 TaxID=1658109 RepID=UPI00067EF496|nr:hypothetical protein [Candidatus Stoquefichus sp. SB1]